MSKFKEAVFSRLWMKVGKLKTVSGGLESLAALAALFSRGRELLHCIALNLPGICIGIVIGIALVLVLVLVLRCIGGPMLKSSRTALHCTMCSLCSFF